MQQKKETMKNASRPAQAEKEQFSILEFGKSKVAFEEINGNMMVNATQMAKPFGKQPVEWLRNQQAQDLLAEMTKLRIRSLADFVNVRRGGLNPGTWFHEDVALLFAQWLSPEFYLACNKMLKQVLQTKALQSAPVKHGVTATLIDGHWWYLYTNALRGCGASHRSSASRRKAKYPQCFKKEFGRNFISGEFFDLLHAQYSAQRMSNQLKLAI